VNKQNDYIAASCRCQMHDPIHKFILRQWAICEIIVTLQIDMLNRFEDTNCRFISGVRIIVSAVQCQQGRNRNKGKVIVNLELDRKKP